MTNTAVRDDTAPLTDIFGAYDALARSLVPELSWICLFDGQLKLRGQSHGGGADSMSSWLKSLNWPKSRERTQVSRPAGLHSQWLAVPLETSDGDLLGIFCACLPYLDQDPAAKSETAATAKRLKPLLDCIHRDLASAKPVSSKVRTLTERTTELEWLFELTNGLKGSSDDKKIIEELLSAATRRLGSALGALHVPHKRLTLTWGADAAAAAPLLDAWRGSAPHLLTWAQRQTKPLVINKPRPGQTAASCKVMSVPLVRDNGRVLGILAFYNPAAADDYLPRHVFLARHIGRQAASLIESQFDLMTGLYTRSGLEQTVGDVCADPDYREKSVLYLDIDHMHVANELHGFELGNELIIRVAELLTPPLLPKEAVAARISGDRFAIVFPESSCDEARAIAEKVRTACVKLVIGPQGNAFDVSISGGVSILLPLEDGVSRAIAAAEIACKAAKKRGRNRIEVYQFEDGSMIRRHRDAQMVGQLRTALKSDRLVLYAQRIAPLQNPNLAGGYEILLRIREQDGELVSVGPFIEAAQRYQLLPAIDRWVVQRALETLAPFRGMLRSREVGMSINVSGQSLGDEAFTQQFLKSLKDANLPRNCVSIELTEQAALSNLARAAEMVKLMSDVGCRFALDDFGTGSNSLTYLKALQTYRVKIDGSFVRDLMTNANSQATVRAVVELARGLKMETVAEYVESEPLAVELKRLGVDYAQGYAFGKPEPLIDTLKHLAEDESARLHRLFLET
jgi:diguanylate cyclase (GGDEF)-like protein